MSSFYYANSPISRPSSPQTRGDANQHTLSAVPSSSRNEISAAAQNSSTSARGTHHHEMFSSKTSHSTLDILLDAETFHIKSLGSSAEPCLLSGKVVLNLSESTSLKEITLHLRGKARLPSTSYENGATNNSNYHTLFVYSHDWVFLRSPGDKKTSHTLKAGSHAFPFQVELPDNTACSMETPNPALGIHYKLRATAVRSGFATNFHAQRPVTILRSLARDALEYQQTLEIENTWPHKMMYSIMIPHKAWAAGDTVCALMKFAPMHKGVAVESIVTTVKETTKMHYRSGTTQQQRVIASIKHEMWSGQPRVVDTYAVHPSSGSQGGMFYIPRNQVPEAHPGLFGAPQPITDSGPSSGTSTPLLEGRHSLNRYNSREAESSSASNSASSSSRGSRNPSHLPVRDQATVGESDSIVIIPITLPPSSTPSHSLSPIEISYRIQWVVLIINPDGHSSELRCSLPLMVLDHALLDEARLATNETRRLCFGLVESEDTTNVDEIELPSYSNHVLDRVANSFFPADSVRVRNNWPKYGMANSMFLKDAALHGPNTPPENAENPLDYVNVELMHSLGQGWRTAHENILTPRSSIDETSASTSASQSRRPSRPSSRATSPERGTQSRERHHHNRFFHSLKPFTSLASSRNSSTARHQSHASPLSISATNPSPHNSTTPATTPPAVEMVQPVPLRTSRDSQERESILMSAFTEVPGYDVASRGFLGGGVPPLDMLRGLPSYEESGRESNPSSRSSHSQSPPIQQQQAASC